MSDKGSKQNTKQRINQLESILSSLDTGLSVINPDHTISWVNDKIYKMFPKADPIGQICHHFYESSDKPCEPCPTFQCFKSGRVEEIQRFNPVNKRWYRIISQPIKDGDGQVVNVLEGVTDITGHKQAEEALAKSLKHYNELVERVPVGVYVFWIRADGGMEFEYVSDRFCAIFQLNREEVMADFTLAFDTVHPDEREDHLAQNQKAFREGKPFLWEGRFIINGKLRWFHIESTPEVSSKGDTRWFGILQDITERKKAEQALEKIQWLLEKEKPDSQKTAMNYIPDYGDVTQFNTDRTILDNVGAETLKILCADIMDLLDTSIAIYEKNGDYAFGQFDSTWCQAMDSASFRLCDTQDTQEALSCGKWLCHENCWNDSAKEAIKTQKTTDIECVGGIRLYAVPVFAGKNLIGVVNMGYGNPPTDERILKELAEKYHVEYEVLLKNATKYKARPPFIIKNAKKRLHTIAQLIGQIVDNAQKEKQIKKAKERAEKSEIKLKHIIEHSTNLFYSHTTDHEITFVSPQVQDLLGYEPEEVMRRWTELVTDNPVNEEGFKRTEEAIKTGKRQPTYHLELERKDSQKITVEVREAPVIENGKVVSIVGSLADITERRQAEDALQKSHERFLAVLNSIDATIHVADMQNYEVLFMNKYMIDSFGGDMTGEACWKALRGESGPCSYCHNGQLVDENGKPTGVHTWQGQNPITGKWYINYDRAIEWTDGRLVKIQIATDITEMKQIEAQLRQAHKMESIGTLAGGIAHEFNNMLGIIIGNTELALDDVPESNPARECLEEIRTASLRAKDVVRQIMSFSQKTPAARTPVQISTIIQDSLKLMRATIPANIEVNQEILCKDERILANPTEINQIFLNLCSNAVHAMEDKTGMLQVRLERADLDHQNAARYEDLTPGQYVKLTVEDTGTGIDPTIMASIFDPYFTTKDVDKGLGMGLAVVYGIVKKHDGAIQIKSRLGAGTAAEVLFPITQDLPETDSQACDDHPAGTETIRKERNGQK